MKKINQFNNGKLQLKKTAIANLTRTDMMNVNGGEAAVTTSFGKCTGFACCGKNESIEITIKIITDLVIKPKIVDIINP